jgi:hypothetical protein
MSPKTRVRHRLNVVLQMVTALITAILLAQLWLFTVTLDAMENQSVSMNVAIAAIVCSLLACVSVWVLIRFFLRTERTEAGERL